MFFVTDRAHAIGPRVAIETTAGGTEHGHGALIGLLGHLSLKVGDSYRQQNTKTMKMTAHV